MTRAKQLSVTNYKGIDRRRKIQVGEAKSLWDAANLDLTRGGELRTRDRLELTNVLPTGSIGLYSFGGNLHTAVPAGNSLEDLAPVGWVFDAIAYKSGANPLDRYTKLESWTSWGATRTGAPQPYLVLKKTNGANEHHYVDGSDLTRVYLPFNPGDDIVKLQHKLHSSGVDGTVHYSSTEFGPRNWDAENDAGFIDVLNQSAGSSSITGLTFFGKQLAVFFPDSVQFWEVDENPDKFGLLRTLNGPGTEFFGSVTPVVADLYYFSLGGFHSLRTTNVLGETREGDIGAPIEELTKAFEADAVEAFGFWSPARSQYLCFFAGPSTTRVFVRTVSPLGGVDGWTYWDLDIPVEYVTEVNGITYVRSGDNVYKFVPTVEGENLSYTWNAETMMFDGERPLDLKKWNQIDFQMDGTIDVVKYRVDTQNPDNTYVGLYNVTGTTSSLGAMPVEALSHKLGILMTGTQHWDLASVTLQYLDLSGAG